jgi:hypothetical protein
MVNLYSQGESIAKRLIKERGARVDLQLVGDDQGNRYWLYLFSTEREYEKMQNVIASGQKYNPLDYGVLLMGGNGEVPPVSIDKMIQDILDGKLIVNKGNK